MPLNDEEKNICEELIIKGEAYLVDLGWKKYDRTLFLRRKEVTRELDRLKGLYADQPGIQARTAFFAQLHINRLVPAAVNVLALSLRGDRVKKVKDKTTGNMVEVVVHSAPSRAQFDAAIEVLDRVGATGKGQIESMGDVPTNIFAQVDARSVHIGDGDLTDAAMIESRDKVRRFLSMVEGSARKAADAVHKRNGGAKRKAEEEIRQVEAITSSLPDSGKARKSRGRDRRGRRPAKRRSSAE